MVCINSEKKNIFQKGWAYTAGKVKVWPPPLPHRTREPVPFSLFLAGTGLPRIAERSRKSTKPAA